jgi:UDP-3-O-[3-hydroxymyristoyl] glucosamine N-acyltransferase
LETRTLAAIAAHLQGELEGDPALEIHGLAGVLDAEPGELTFVINATYGRLLAQTRASAVLVPRDFGPVALPAIRVAQPEGAMESLVPWFRGDAGRPAPGIDPTAVIAADAAVAKGAVIGPQVSIGAMAVVGARAVLHAGCRIGAGAVLGDDVEVHPNAVIGARVRIGSRVVIHAGAMLGADGFGFRPGPRGLEKLEHIGIVVLGDDVEIGAGTTIDRARFGRTVVGRGTKIDNLCQIAHNVRIGQHCVIAAQSGISGSTVIGDGCMIGGQVGTVGHVRIGDGCRIAARSGISKDTPPGSVVYGFVAGPHLERKREEAAVRRLPELLDRVRRIERREGGGAPDRVAGGGPAAPGRK